MNSWPVMPLGEVADVRLGKMLDKSKHLAGRKLPYLRNINVRWGSVDTSDLLEMNFKDDELDRFGLRHGDVLVCEGGEPGRAAVWSASVEHMKFQKALHRVRCSPLLNPKFLVAVLEHYAKSGRLRRFFTGSTIKHFTGESFSVMPVPLPPPEEQNEIVAELERRLTVIESVEAEVQHGLKRAVRLRQSVLKRAFEGRLVEQNSAEEPARPLSRQ